MPTIKRKINRSPGIDSDVIMTFDQIAEEMNISRRWAQQLCENGMKKMRINLEKMGIDKALISE